MIDSNINCRGFRFAGVAAGLKKQDMKDLGLIVSDIEANVAGVFTRNRVKAAPVLLDQQRVQSGMARSVIVNSGNANCSTGEKGMQDAVEMAACTAGALGIDEKSVLVASTGVIGTPFPIEKVTAAIPGLVDSLKPDAVMDLAEAIMTTDTIPKVVSKQGTIDGRTFTVTALAKGAGMIRPDMATMLCFVCTDACVSPDILKNVLVSATDKSFNRITVDGDTSTNDTVLILANGLSGAEIKAEANRQVFQEIVDNLLGHLAKMIVKDGEGATKLIEIIVRGALTDRDARMTADTIANSNLVKTAFFGEDANWGRILAAAGRSGVPIDPDKTDVYFDDVMMARNGLTCGDVAEAQATEVLKKSEFTVTLDLNMGSGQASVLTCDFSLDYVRINADYRS